MHGRVWTAVGRMVVQFGLCMRGKGGGLVDEAVGVEGVVGEEEEFGAWEGGAEREEKGGGGAGGDQKSLKDRGRGRYL